MKKLFLYFAILLCELCPLSSMAANKPDIFTYSKLSPFTETVKDKSGDDFRSTRFKGFLDFSMSGTIFAKEKEFNLGIQPSFGIQCNPYFFIGSGFGLTGSIYRGEILEEYYGSGYVDVPVFGQIRGNFCDEGISPYFDLKGGYFFHASECGFIQPSFGVSMPVANRFAVDFAFSYCCYFQGDNIHSFALTFGFEF